MSKWNDITPRRFLPPLAWLSAFEAVARQGSVTLAARELNLTQGAVSRQIQKLEAQLGLCLFRRHNQKLHLTEIGARYAAEIREGLKRITGAGIKLQVNPNGGLLNLAVLPAFGTYWLAPRLPDFLTRNAGVTLNLSTRTRPFDFTKETEHAAIHFGDDDWRDTHSILLMREEVVAVASPDLIYRNGYREPPDIRNLPLLHLETRPHAWDVWLASEGICCDVAIGYRFDQFAAMIQATRSGLGAAVVPDYLVTHDLENGQLVQIGKTASIGCYYLVWPEQYADYPPLQAFKLWISDIMGGTMLLPS